MKVERRHREAAFHAMCGDIKASAEQRDWVNGHDMPWPFYYLARVAQALADAEAEGFERGFQIGFSRGHDAGSERKALRDLGMIGEGE